MPSLYQAGWRQGSVLAITLGTTAAVYSGDQVEYEMTSHDRWIVVSQDCDLDLAEASENHPRIEVRPVYASDAGPHFDPESPYVWGVRSRKFRLNQQRDFVHAESERLMVSPAVLTRHVASRTTLMDDERTVAFTSWLGRRYDRPAVPEDLVPPAVELSRLVKAEDHLVRDHIHDVLMSFTTTVAPPEITLWVVTCDADHSESCCGPGCSDDHVGAARQWASAIAQSLATNLGTVGQIRAGSRDQTSMRIIETAYSVDASDITFRKDGVHGV